MPCSLVAGAPATGFALTNIGSLDLDLFQPLLIVYDGIGLFGNPDGTTSPKTLTFGLPIGVTGFLASVQGVSFDPGWALGVALTARNDLGVQDVSALGPPRMAPFLGGGPTPVPGAASPTTCATGTAVSTTATHPFPRDGICPNNGPVGTRHSALGENFDATNPAATYGFVNNFPVIPKGTRPNEFFFEMTAAHAPSIGGPLVMTSTGGSNGATMSPDQMESWVWVTPDPNLWLPEFPGGGYVGGVGGISGAFVPSPGVMQAGIGSKTLFGEIDYWSVVGLTPSVPITVFLGQYDPASGQILTQCSGLYATPAATCFTGSVEPYSMQWYAQNCFQDTWLHHGQESLTTPGTPDLGVFLASQDDGGPGTDSFAGMSQVPGSATVPASDPDGPFTATSLDWLVADDFANTSQGSYPYTYLLLFYTP